MAALYYRRIRAQPLRRTLREMLDPARLARHLRLFASGDSRARSNSYLPSFSRDQERNFCAAILDSPPDQVEDLFAELESESHFVASLREHYRITRGPEAPGLELGRFKVWYAIVRTLKPAKVVETGVHDGLSSAIILRAMERNAAGRLVSIDLPSTDLPPGIAGPGWLVPEFLKSRWRLCLGDARDLLPQVAGTEAPIDIFIHDSDHSPEHMEFEYRTVRPRLASRALILSDADLEHELLDRLAIEWSVPRFRFQSVAAQLRGPQAGRPDFIGGLRIESRAAGDRTRDSFGKILRSGDQMIVHGSAGNHEAKSRAGRNRGGRTVRSLLSGVALATAVGAGGSVAGAADQFALIHRLVAGGTNPEAHPTEAEFQALHELNTYRMRIINGDNNLAAVGADDSLQLKWSPILENGLRLCQSNGWIPRVVIGLKVPAPLMATRPDGTRYGPSSWPTYDRYTQAFLKHLTQEWKFSKVELEVGNEMDIPANNWVAAVKPRKGPAAQEGFDAYVILYRHIGKVVAAYREQHPEFTIKLGGPALARPFLGWRGQADWATQLVRVAAADHLPLDFVSTHAYGNDASANKMKESLRSLQSEMAAVGLTPHVSVSEYGMTAAANLDINFEPVAGAWMFEFAHDLDEVGIDDAIFLSLSEFYDGPYWWPTLFRRDGSPTHYFIAMKAMAEFNGQRLICTSPQQVVQCFAAQQPSGAINVIAWRLSWRQQPIPNLTNWPQGVGPTRIDIEGLSMPPPSNAMTNISVNAVPRGSIAGAVSRPNPGAIQVRQLPMPLGGYVMFTLGG